MTHSELCKLALNWLKRPASRGGHGCKVAIDECSTGWDGEIPDALGYRFAGNAMDGTVLVECKVSRSDFLADKNKPHRHTRGVGNWRYYMAPEGIISPAELPDRWGLVEVNSRGHLKTVVGAFSDSNYSLQQSRLVDMRHDSDTTREFFLVVRMFERVAEPEKIIDLTKERNRLAFRTAELANTLRMAEKKAHELGWQVTQLNNQLARYSALHGPLADTEAIPRIVADGALGNPS